MSSKLSVNVNKFATLRNARGGNLPNLVQVALDIEAMGVKGITVHPRPDERHIRYEDVFELRKVLSCELNIEGNPQYQPFVDLVLATRPTQVTLVPDSAQALSSNSGWDCVANAEYLREIVAVFRGEGIRCSIFVNPSICQIEAAKTCGTDAVELYTEAYAKGFADNPAQAITPYLEAAKIAQNLGLALHAGHDLNLQNIEFLYQNIPFLQEVSIGHALICEAIYLGLANTIAKYRKILG